MTKFAIGCTHWSHKNICGPTLTQWTSGYRNYSSLEEMNEDIYTKINSRVGENDELYHLGDVAFGDKKLIPYHLSRLKCKNIYLIYGNHDGKIRENEEYQKCFKWCKDYYEFFHHGLLLTMFHYPIGSWNGQGAGAINIHSHCHGSYTRTVGRQIDVGFDAFGKFPVNLDILVNDMRKIKPYSVDHHTSTTPIY